VDDSAVDRRPIEGRAGWWPDHATDGAEAPDRIDAIRPPGNRIDTIKRRGLVADPRGPAEPISSC